MKITNIAIASLAAATLAACATTPRAGPAEVTSFVAAERAAELGQGTIFIESAPGQNGDSLRLADFKAAVARELTQLGYREVPRDQAGQIALVRIDRAVSNEAPQRSPVSVGVGGSTGSFGSGVGVGLGINLGGGNRNARMVNTNLGVMIRDKASGETIWEGRADFGTDTRHALADPEAAAQALAGALFSRFPEGGGEPVIVELTE